MGVSRFLFLCWLGIFAVSSSLGSDNNKQLSPVGPNKYTTIDASLMNRVIAPSGAHLVDVLALLQDTVYGSANQIAAKQADNDTALKYIAQMVPGAAFLMRDTNQTTVPSLRAYRTVILIETSFVLPSLLQRAQRDSLKAFLAAGVAGNEKSLIVFGGDFAYNYDRSPSSALDTTLSRTLLKHRYLFDDGNVIGQDKMRGIAINNNVSDSLVSTAYNFYPDAVHQLTGADTLYGYVGRSIRDSIGGVGYNGPTYNSAVIFADPRYIVAKANDSTGGFKRVLAGVLTYINNAGGSTFVERTSDPIAGSFALMQNFPNPFNPSTTIRFSIPRSSFVSLQVFDVLGREVATLVNGTTGPGEYSVQFDAHTLSSGIYLYRLQAGSFVATRKLLLMR